jgi:hypothetical protein
MQFIEHACTNDNGDGNGKGLTLEPNNHRQTEQARGPRRGAHRVGVRQHDSGGREKLNRHNRFH